MLGNVDEVDIANYLNAKYGDDIEFTPMYTSSCKIYETGTCRASYTASDTGEKEIPLVVQKKIECLYELAEKNEYVFALEGFQNS